MSHSRSPTDTGHDLYTAGGSNLVNCWARLVVLILNCFSMNCRNVQPAPTWTAIHTKWGGSYSPRSGSTESHKTGLFQTTMQSWPWQMPWPAWPLQIPPSKQVAVMSQLESACLQKVGTCPRDGWEGIGMLSLAYMFFACLHYVFIIHIFQAPSITLN